MEIGNGETFTYVGTFRCTEFERKEDDGMNRVYEINVIHKRKKEPLFYEIVIAKTPEEAKFIRADLKDELDRAGVDYDDAYIICNEIGAFKDVK
jgi:hypothetical protein